MDINISAEKLYEYLKSTNRIIFETIVGSQVYNTNTPESDVDKKFIYILPDYLFGYIPQIHVNKDYVGFELGEFMKLIQTANPTMLELLGSPDDCIIHKDPIFDLILQEKDKFITKKCAQSFGGYGLRQMKKAMGQDKMMNWEKQKTQRKSPIDFCFVVDGYKTKSLKKYLKDNKYEQKFCGIVNVSNAKDLFALFYDLKAHLCFAKSMDDDDKEYNKKTLKERGDSVGLGYKGVVKEGGSDNMGIANNLRLSSIPKGEEPICIFSYNKDAYTQHCKDYNKYQNWLKVRNNQRWVDTESHGQVNKEKNSKIDSKNIMHLVRLLNMSREISEGKGLIVRRPDAEYLKSIRRGEVGLQKIIDYVEDEMKIIDEQFEKSNLPETVDLKFVEQLTNKIRNNFHEKN
jgi:hypothetical protein